MKTLRGFIFPPLELFPFNFSTSINLHFSFFSSHHQRFILFAFSFVIFHEISFSPFPFFFCFSLIRKSILSVLCRIQRRMFYRSACTHGMLFVLLCSSSTPGFAFMPVGFSCFAPGLKNNFRARRIYLCLKDVGESFIFFILAFIFHEATR